MLPYAQFLVSPAGSDLVVDKIDAVHLVRVAGQVDADLVRFEVPELFTRRLSQGLQKSSRRTFNVESFEAETSMRESLDQLTR
jgi:hypothetical protein